MLGIDVSQTTLADSLLAADSQHLLAAGSVPNTPAGISQLLAQIPADQPWVVEPTGPYSRPLVRQAHAEGRTVLLAPRRRPKPFCRPSPHVPRLTGSTVRGWRGTLSPCPCVPIRCRVRP